MADPLFLRPADLNRLQATLADGACCSVVGLSNVGKSTLLRAAEAELDPNVLAVYVDCNLMLALTDQALYEVTLRSALDAVKQTEQIPAGLVAEIDKRYHQVVDAAQPGTLIAPLGFNEGVALLCEQLNRRVVLMFDEFDDPFDALDGRVFLNLRALHDKYDQLVYVTATGAPLAERRHDPEAGEFCELFVGHQLSLGMPTNDMARRAVDVWAREEGARLEPDEVDFVVEQAGGHPGLLRAATRMLDRVASGAPIDSRGPALNLVRDGLESDMAVRSDCATL